MSQVKNKIILKSCDDKSSATLTSFLIGPKFCRCKLIYKTVPSNFLFSIFLIYLIYKKFIKLP